MTRTIMIALALSCFTVGRAAAGFVDGNKLFSDCEGQSGGGDSAWGVCVGYVMGAADASETICLPNGVTVGQVRDVVTMYLRNHPERRHYAASSLVETALKEKLRTRCVDP